METLLFCWIAIAFVCGVIAALVGDMRGRGNAGFALGFFFGPLGILVALVIPRSVAAEAQHQLAIEQRKREIEGVGRPSWPPFNRLAGKMPALPDGRQDACPTPDGGQEAEQDAEDRRRMELAKRST